MNRSYNRFALLALLIALLRLVLGDGFDRDHTPQALPASPIVNLDAEGRLAAREKLALACADMSGLELISGVSDRLASELVNERKRIVSQAQADLSHEEAMQLAHGVGAATAKKLLKYLSLSESCMEVTNELDLAYLNQAK